MSDLTTLPTLRRRTLLGGLGAAAVGGLIATPATAAANPVPADVGRPGRGVDKARPGQAVVLTERRQGSWRQLNGPQQVLTTRGSMALAEIPPTAAAGSRYMFKFKPERGATVIKAIHVCVPDVKVAPADAVLVDDFRQAGDIDDTMAIRRAVAAATAVRFGPRTYTVSPTISPDGWGRIVPLPGGRQFYGAGKDATVIRLADNIPQNMGSAASGELLGWFTGETVPTDVSGFRLYDLTLDANSQNNPLPPARKETGYVKWRRIGVRLSVGTDLAIENVRFTNFNTIWMVYIDGSSVSNVRIVNCDFDNFGHQAAPGEWANDYDATGVYLNAKGMTVTDCIWNTPHPYGSRTPAEFHGTDALATRNTVHGHRFGHLVVGSKQHGPFTGTMSHNAFLDVVCGYDLWAMTIIHRIDRAELTDSWITLDYANPLFHSVHGAQGLSMSASNDESMNGIDFSWNTVITTSRPDKAVDGDPYSSMVTLFHLPSVKASKIERDLRITHNECFDQIGGLFAYEHIMTTKNSDGTTTSTPLSGLDGVTITDNLLSSPLSGKAMVDAERYAVKIRCASLAHYRYERNQILGAGGLLWGARYDVLSLVDVVDGPNTYQGTRPGFQRVWVNPAATGTVVQA